MDKKTNPIALQSKERIVEALFDLLYVKPFPCITISEIAENAELDRRTFYRHFSTKEDIISHYVREASKQYEDVMKQAATFDNFLIAKAFFEVCESNKETLQILYKQNLLHLLLPDFSVIFNECWKRFASLEELQQENSEYCLAYHTGGFWNLLIKWLEEDCRNTSEQMGEIIENILLAKQI